MEKDEFEKGVENIRAEWKELEDLLLSAMTAVSVGREKLARALARNFVQKLARKIRRMG